MPPSILTISPYTPIEGIALNYWVHNFTEWPEDLLGMGHDYGTYATYYLDRSKLGSSLHLAVSAMSLAVFGLGTGAGEALDIAKRSYAQCIMKIQKEINVLDNETINHLLITTKLMATYAVCSWMLPLVLPNLY